MQYAQRRRVSTVTLAAAFIAVLSGSTWGDEVANVSALTEAAKRGDARAEFELGAMYNSGRGVRKDVTKAFRLIRKAAHKGDPDAQFHLGVMFEKGRGMPKNIKKAIKWYRKAADQGHVDAQYTLSSLHRDGYGVQKDNRKAEGWYRGAAGAWSNVGTDAPFLRHE